MAKVPLFGNKMITLYALISSFCAVYPGIDHVKCYSYFLQCSEYEMMQPGLVLSGSYFDGQIEEMALRKCITDFEKAGPPKNKKDKWWLRKTKQKEIK